MIRTAFVVFWGIMLIVACSTANDEPEPLDAVDPIPALFDSTGDRLLANHVENGYVVTRKPNGEREHWREGILWSGVAVYALDCERARSIMEPLVNHIFANGGGLRRFEPYPVPDKRPPLNFDGFTGFALGVASFAVHCPDAAREIRLADAWEAWTGFVDANHGELWPGTGETIPALFRFTRRAVSHFFGQSGAPDDAALRDMEVTAAGWAGLVKTWKEECYRINLGLIHLRIAETLGYELSPFWRDRFCEASAGTDIPTVEHYCGREHISNWVSKFRFNEWEYRHQRCGAWESPDGDGDTTPAADLLLALRLGYKLPK